MSKFVRLDEAAKMLGLSVEDLKAARDRNEIHGYRDGASWKFKVEEVERFAEEQSLKLGSVKPPAGQPQDEDEELLGVPDLLGDEDDDSILVSDEAQGAPHRSSSTIIGAGQAPSAESDIRLAESDLVLGGDETGSDVLGGGSSKKLKSASDSDVQLVLDDAGSDVKVVPGSSSHLLGEATGSGSDELKIDIAGGSGTGELESGGSDKIGLDSDLDVDLSLSDEDELVLSESSTGGSDVMVSGSDTGINLASPSDSGLSLDDEALDLGSISSLELPEDQEQQLDLTAEAAPGPLQDEFLLEPTGAATDEEDTSGSQIIELDSAFELPGGPAIEGEAVGLEAEPVAEVAEFGEEAAVRYAAPPETPYSVYNVLFLFCTVAVLSLVGILMFDVTRNMWSWNQNTDRSMASSLMDGIVSAVGLNK